MPLTTSSIPFLEEQPVAEPKKTAPPKEQPKLARASESGNAEIQNLLAQRGGYEVNGMDDKVAEVDARLAELGYAVY